MTRLERVLLGTLVLLGTEASALGAQAAAPVAVPRYAAAIDSARAAVGELLARQPIPGVAGAAAVNGDLVWSEGFGYADLEQRIPVTGQSMFRIGSVSKPITAAAVMRLVETGRLDLDAPVQRYVPDFPDKPWPITTRQLAGHLAGIRHYRGLEFLLNRPFATVRAGLALFERDSLLHEPGTAYFYSSYGWNLISAVVEGAAGEEFLAHLRRAVFTPLRLLHTAPDRKDSVIPERTRFYGIRNGVAMPEPEVDNSYKWAGGGLLSTPEDLVRLASAHLAPGYLMAASLETLFTSQRTMAGEETGYGIGWYVAKDAAGRRVVRHGGGSVGGTAMLLLYPDQGVAVAIVANVSGAEYRDVPRRIAEAFVVAAPVRTSPR